MTRKARRRLKRRLSLFLVLVIIVCVLFYDSNTRLVTETFTLGNKKLPKEFEGFKIVQLSDLHTTEFGEGSSELLSAVSAEAPDIIAITGDLIDEERAEEYVSHLITELVKIAPVYYVSGNHEFASGWHKELFELLTESGARVLRNEYEILTRGESTIVLAGVDDPNGPYDMKTPGELVLEIRQESDGYILMLAHRNDELGMWSELKVDAVLCGHAHGGLIRLPFTDGLVAPGQGFFPTYTAGIYTEGETQMLVSRGLGNSRGVPRLFNNPQIVSAVLTCG